MTYDQSSSDQAHDCSSITDLIAEIESEAARGEFDRGAKDTLQTVADSASQALQAYMQDTGYKALLGRWESQKERIVDLGKRLTKCFPNWVDILRCHVCDEVIKPIRETRYLLYGPAGDCPSCENGPKIGLCESDLVAKDWCLAQATTQRDAWTDITTWIGTRLDDNQALYDEICALDKCEDFAVALYIYFFELLPAHRGLDPYQRPPLPTFEEQCCGGRGLPECKLEGFPWLITPDNYLAQLDKVACAWLEAGRNQAKAQAAFDQIEVLKANLSADDTPESRRAKATELLKNLKCTDDDTDDGGNQYPDPDCDTDPYPRPDSGSKSDPDSYRKPESDPYPSPDSSHPQTS